jgi:hypothetical protein
MKRRATPLARIHRNLVPHSLFSAEKGHPTTHNIMNVAASNYMYDTKDNGKFNMENYQASKKKDKAELVARRSEDCLSHGADDSADDEEEETQLLPEDQVHLDDLFENTICTPPTGNAGLSNGVKSEGGLVNAVSSIKHSKRRAAAMVTYSAHWDDSHFMAHEQYIRACLLVSEVCDLLITDPDGYENMLIQDKSRVCISGNGEDKFYVKKSALFVEVTCGDKGKYFQPLFFGKKLTLIN